VPPQVPETLAFADIATEYFKRHVNVPTRRKAAAKYIENYVHILKRLENPVGSGHTAALALGDSTHQQSRRGGRSLGATSRAGQGRRRRQSPAWLQSAGKLASST